MEIFHEIYAYIYIYLNIWVFVSMVGRSNLFRFLAMAMERKKVESSLKIARRQTWLAGICLLRWAMGLGKTSL